MNWLLRFLANLFARIFKDWRRDRALQEAGAIKAREDGLHDIVERARKARASAQRARDDGVPERDRYRRE